MLRDGGFMYYVMKDVYVTWYRMYVLRDEGCMVRDVGCMCYVMEDVCVK